MNVKLTDQQLKRTTFIYRILYQNLMVITNQKSIIDIHTKRKKKNPNTKLKTVIKSQKKRTKRGRGAGKSPPLYLAKHFSLSMCASFCSDPEQGVTLATQTSNQSGQNSKNLEHP